MPFLGVIDHPPELFAPVRDACEALLLMECCKEALADAQADIAPERSDLGFGDSGFLPRSLLAQAAFARDIEFLVQPVNCLLYTSPSPRDRG